MMQDQLPQTESINPKTQGLDQADTATLVRMLVEEQKHAVDVVLENTAAIARAVDVIALRLRDGGRLHYVGAGTSGRLGFLDASEIPPTFGTVPELVCAHIAGGLTALTRAVENAEDDGEAGAAEMVGHVEQGDVVIGISASGGAPYVVGAILAAKERGAYTIAVANSPGNKIGKAADQSIVLETGAEPLTGSTRLKAGTAQKLILNAISTAVMVRLGKVYDNLMVDVVATNEKLRQRCQRLVIKLTGVTEAQASELLLAAGGSVKVAAVMKNRGLDPASARKALDEAHGSLRTVCNGLA